MSDKVQPKDDRSKVISEYAQMRSCCARAYVSHDRVSVSHSIFADDSIVNSYDASSACSVQ